MLCSRCREQLTLWLSDALAPPERAALEAHLAACPNCARELRALQNIGQTLASLPAAPVPPRVRANVRAALSAPPRRTFVLPNFGARGLAWGGALAVGAIGLMLVARPLQTNFSSAPATDIGAGGALAPPAELKSDAPSAAAPNAKSSGAGQTAANSVAASKAKMPSAAKVPAAKTSPAQAPLAPAPATSHGAPANGKFSFDDSAASSRKSPRVAPDAASPKRAAQAPSEKPMSPAPPKPRFSGGSQAPLVPRAQTQESASPSALTAPRSDGAKARPQKLTRPDAAPRASDPQRVAPFGLAKPNGAAALESKRAGDPAPWTNGAVTATLAHRAPRALMRAGVGDSKSRDDSSMLRAAPPAAKAAPATPQADDSRAAEPQTNAPAPPPPAPLSSSESAPSAPDGGRAKAAPAPSNDLAASSALAAAPVTLFLRAAQSVGPARLMLITPDGETEIWRGTLGMAPLEIPLPAALTRPLKLRGGQTIRARLEQLDARGQPSQSLPLELLWP